MKFEGERDGGKPQLGPSRSPSPSLLWPFGRSQCVTCDCRLDWILKGKWLWAGFDLKFMRLKLKTKI